MERMVDKLIVWLCCLPALALARIDRATIGLMLLSIALTCIFELVVASRGTADARGKRPDAEGRLGWEAALPLGYCVTSCVLPAGVPFVALAAYDLARCGFGAALSAVAAVPVLLAASSPDASGIELVFSGCAALVGVVLSVRTTHVVRQRVANLRERDLLRAQSLSLETRNRDLLDRQEYEARLATLSERSRIARDIHDNVGHLITRAVVQTEALKVVHADDAQVAGELDQLSGTLHEALDTLRASVHAMADEACDLSVQVRQAAEEACEQGGLACECSIEASEATPAVTACLLAVVREAVSNTLRHAEGATRVEVELVERPALWRLVVTDDGRQPERHGGDVRQALPASDGLGLASMSERVRALGGTLTAGFDPGAGGFRVFASIPKQQTPRPSPAGGGDAGRGGRDRGDDGSDQGRRSA